MVLRITQIAAELLRRRHASFPVPGVGLFSCAQLSGACKALLRAATMAQFF